MAITTNWICIVPWSAKEVRSRFNLSRSNSEATFGRRGRDHIVESLRAGKIQDSSGARSISILFE